MGKGIAVVGTDVGVGKTVVAAGIAGALVERGVRVGVMKPVAIDAIEVDGKLISRDAYYLQLVSQVVDDPALINPYLYETQIAPSVAARLERREEVDLKLLEDRYFELTLLHEFIVVDTIGGLLSPLNETETNLDLFLRLGLDILVVGHGRIGTINHTLLTVQCARTMGLHVSGIVIDAHNTYRIGMIERTNPQEIERFSQVPLLGVLPWIDGVDVQEGQFLGLVETVKRRIELDPLLLDDDPDWPPDIN